jgi:hypothetical protein
MIRFSLKAVDHIRAAIVPSSPMSYYVNIFWDDGDINNLRSAEGNNVWVKNASRGWSLDLCPYHKDDTQELKLQNSSGIHYRIESKHGFECPDAKIDVVDGKLTITF